MKRLAIKTVLIVVFAFGMTTFANAQFSIGGKIGMNLANVSGSDKPDDAKMKMRMAYGIVANYGISDMFSLLGEVNISGKGFGIKDYTETNEGVRFEYENMRSANTYLTIPILAKATFGNSTKFFALAGPYFGFLMSAKFKGDYSISSDMYPELNDSNSVNEDAKDAYNGFDFGLTVGGGAIFPITDALDITADVRYNMGFSNIADDDDTKLHNSVIGINAGVVYKFNK